MFQRQMELFDERLTDLENISKKHSEKITYTITARSGNGIVFRAELPAFINGKRVNVNHSITK